MYIRQDAARPTLTPPYAGPYKVLERKDKTFVIELGDRRDTVSIDRLKPAHLDPDQPVYTPAPKRRGRPPRTRSGGGCVAEPAN